MIYIATLVAIVLSYLMGEKLADFILILYYHRHYIKEEHYMELYDLSDHKYIYDMYRDNKGKKLKTYAQFFKRHHDTRDKAYEYYKKHMYTVSKQIIIMLGVYLLLPMIIFYKVWFIYLVVFSIGIGAHMAYKRIKKQYDFAFYAMLIITLVLNESLKDKS